MLRIMPTNARQEGWSIRGYEAGHWYADVYCPHGQCVDCINTDGQPIVPRVALAEWIAESRPALRDYCLGHDAFGRSLRQRCPDCGEPGEQRGHMECQYPSND